MKYDTTKDTSAKGCVRDKLRKRMEEHLIDSECSSIKCGRMEAIRTAWIASECTCGDPDREHMEGFQGYRAALCIIVKQHLVAAVMKDDSHAGNVAAIKVMQHVGLEVETMTCKDIAVFVERAVEANNNGETSTCQEMLIAAIRCLIVNESTLSNLAETGTRTYGGLELASIHLKKTADALNDTIRALVAKGVLARDEVPLIDTSEISTTFNYVESKRDPVGYVTPEDVYQGAHDLAVNQDELDEIRERYKSI